MSEQKHITKLADLVNLIPHKEWNYTDLTQNPNITPEDILHKLMHIPKKDARKIPERNVNIDIQMVSKYPNKGWDWAFLSKNLPIRDIISNPQLPWIYTVLSQRRGISIDFVISKKGEEWNNFNLAMNLNLEDILAHPELSEIWKNIEYNSEITWDIVKKYPEKKWDYRSLSKNLPLEEIIEHPEIKWHFACMSLNNTLTSEYLLQNLDNEWDVKWLSTNSNLNFDILADSKEDLSELFSFDLMIFNKSITLKFFIKYIDKFDESLDMFDLGKYQQDKNGDYYRQIKYWNSDDDRLTTYLSFFKNVYNGNKNFEEVVRNSFYSEVPTELIIEKFKSPLKRSIIGLSPYLTIDSVSTLPVELIDYSLISVNPVFGIADIISHPEIPWNLNDVMTHLDIEDIIKAKEIGIKWNYKSLSSDKRFKVEDIIKGRKNGIKWDYELLSSNPNLTFDFIYENKNKDWDWEELSNNPFIEQSRLNQLELISNLNSCLIPDLTGIVLDY
jgi:hypothetical protein